MLHAQRRFAYWSNQVGQRAELWLFVNRIYRYFKKIGIDIQYFKKNIFKISKKFISPEENSQNLDIIKLHFIWCAKEAVYKTLNGKSCSFKESIYIENVINGNITNGHYNHKKMSVKYDIYCEIFEEYFMSIAMIKSW